MDPAALRQAGFEPDPLDLRGAYLVSPGGERLRVFLKRARKPERRVAELTALALLQAQAPAAPFPRVVSSFDLAGEPYLAFAYQTGANLADLLEPGPRALPRPQWYEPVSLAERPPLPSLLPLLSEVGRAVRALHSVHLAGFGRLPGTGVEPNPHRANARAFTAQEFAHRIRTGLDKGTLPPALAEACACRYEQEAEHLEEDEPPCLVHFDLHAGNIRVTESGEQWQLSSLYDFELARGWLPEWDLAILAWDLGGLAGEDPSGCAWQAFVAGYGPIDPDRLRLFQVMYLLTTIAYADRYPEWGRWGLARLGETINLLS